MSEIEMCNQNFVSIVPVFAGRLEGSLKSRLPASTRVVRITTAMLGKRSSGMGAVIQALSIALQQIADRKEVRFTQATRSKCLVTSKQLYSQNYETLKRANASPFFNHILTKRRK